MKSLIHLSILVLAVTVLVAPSFSQELSKDEWQKQVADLTTKRNDLKNKLDAAVKEVSTLKSQEAEKADALKKCQDDLAALVGAEEAPFQASLDKIDARLNELSKLSNQDLWARKAELDSVQAWINDANKMPLASVQKNADRLRDQQSRLDALKKALEQYVASGAAGQTYTVGTWAKDRDCLWNIAKKPKIYDNPFLWPKIWQGNRDQIKNPDVIQPGQKLKIPAKADLTKEEKSAVRKYWSKKNAAAPATAPAQK